MKNLYTFLFAAIYTAFTFAQPNFYDQCNKVPSSNTGLWNGMGSSDSALYLVGQNGRCFVYYFSGGIKDLNTGSADNLKGVQFLNVSVGYAWGSQGTLLKTTDGGNNWTTITTSIPGIDKVQFLDENNAYCKSGSTIYKTQNGGVLWTQLTLPVGAGFHFFDPLNGLISGGQYVYQTNDGGLTWNLLFTNSYPLDKMYFVNDTIGFIIGNGPFHLYRTTDKGISWNIYSQSFGALQSDIVPYHDTDFICVYTPYLTSYTWILGEATGAFDVHSVKYKGRERLYALSSQGLYCHFNDGPKYQALTFFNGVTPNTTNPINSLIPGSRVRFKINIKNYLSNNLLTLSGKIGCRSPYITVIDSIGTYNNVLSGATAWSADEFEIELAMDIPNNYVAHIELELNDQIQSGDPWNSIFSFPIIIDPIAVNFNIIDDDNIPDSNGDNDDIAEPGETIEIIPLADNVSDGHTFANIEGYLFSPLPEINIWSDTMGSTTTVYNHYPYPTLDTLSQATEDFVFTNNFTSTYNLQFSMVFTGYLNSFFTGLGYITDFNNIEFRWGGDFTMNNGFPNPPNLGVEEKLITDDVQVYPNPNKGEFFIELRNSNQSTQRARIVVTNILGETVYQSSPFINSGLTQTFINMSRYSSGIYHLQLISEQGILTRKIILE